MICWRSVATDRYHSFDKMETFLQQIVNGLALASVYALLAVGITLIFGLTGVVNFAHGEFLIIGGLIGYTATKLGAPFAIAVMVATLAMALAGLIIERFLFRAVADDPIRGFVISLGLIVGLQHAALKIWGSEQQAIDAPLPQILSLGDVRISAMRIVVSIVTGVVLLLFFVLLKRSRWGQALRAIALDRETASSVGVPVGQYVAGTLAVGTALAGMAGALLLSLFPMSPFSGGTYTIKGFAVAIIGGLGSVSGALVAAVLIGLIEAIASGYISPAWTNAYAFAAMILILLLRPAGLRGGSI
jgi:branched-chain amino acid transport system permease protein